MCFHMNRLGFLSGDTVIMSQPGDYFKFFTGSAISISDADPIDMAATSTAPATLKEAISTPQGLILFSRDAQFLMSSKDVAFGPATVQIQEISNYSYEATVEPQVVGDSLFFNTNSTEFSKIYEMALPSVNGTPQVAENTRIVPEYIIKGLNWGASSPNNNLVVYGRWDDPDVYMFKFWNQGKERSLAGWVKWTFSSNVGMMEFADDVAYIVQYNELLDRPVLSRMNLLDDPANATISSDGRKFEPRLDNYVRGQTLTRQVEDDANTRILLPDGIVDQQELVTVQFIRSSGSYYLETEVLGSPGSQYIVLRDRTLQGMKAFNIGVPYTMEVQLPSFYVKTDKVVDRRNLAMVENVYMNLYLSGSYSVVIERQGYDPIVSFIEPKIYDVYAADRSAIITADTKPFSVFTRGDQVKITLTSVSPLPAGIAGYSWEGHYNNRGIASIS